jgi:ankyrin repeat protein
VRYLVSAGSDLISAGSDLRSRNMRGEYPLTLAARCDKKDILECLLKGDSDPKYEGGKIVVLRAVVSGGPKETTAFLMWLWKIL